MSSPVLQRDCYLYVRIVQPECKVPILSASLSCCAYPFMCLLSLLYHNNMALGILSRRPWMSFEKSAFLSQLFMQLLMPKAGEIDLFSSLSKSKTVHLLRLRRVRRPGIRPRLLRHRESPCSVCAYVADLHSCSKAALIWQSTTKQQIHDKHAYPVFVFFEIMACVFPTPSGKEMSHFYRSSCASLACLQSVCSFLPARSHDTSKIQH